MSNRTELTETPTAKVQIRDFDCTTEYISNYGINGVNYDLPRTIVLKDKKYIWLNIPEVWVEENECYRIQESHSKNSPNFDPEKRIWQIFDALTVEEVIELIAESFCDRSPSLAHVPALKPYDMEMLKKAFYQHGFPVLHHDYFVMPKNKNVMNSWDYTRNQLRVETYTI